MKKISAIINTKNAADTLDACLSSLSFADEIIVVDMHSIDKTKAIALSHGVKFLLHDDLGFVEPARNFAIAQAKHDYVLVIDADEVISSGLQKRIQSILKEKEPADVYLIPRQNIVFGQWLKHTGWWPDYQARFFKKGSVAWSSTIHQPPTVSGKVMKLPPEESLAIVHHHYQSVLSYIERLNRYTSVQAEGLLKGYVQQVDQPALVSSFFNEFFRRFFVFFGYKDGVVGTSLSFLQASYELTVLLKMWEHLDKRSHQNEEKAVIEALCKSRSDLSYWLADWNVKNSSGLKKLYWQVRRKARW